MIDNFKSPGGKPTKPLETTATPQNQAQNVTVMSDEIGAISPAAGSSKRGFSFKKPSKKQFIIIGVVIVLLGGGGSAFALTRKKKPTTQTASPGQVKVTLKPEEAPKATTAASKLSGVQIAPEQNSWPVTGVMIENSPDARPQSGLKEAGVVFEAVAEGGITRFMALYLEGQPEYVGPVRSVRPYYLDFLMPFDAAIAHVGGSPEALQQIKDSGTKDLDQFANAGAYQRISSRYAPHNMYTSLPKLVELGKGKGFTASNFTGFPRKADKPSASPNAKFIDMNLSGFLYNTRFTYDPASDSYLRDQAGKPHVDERSKTQIQPKVVIAVVTDQSVASDGVHTVYRTTGSGKAYIFQDGTVTEGIWEKTDRKAMYKFGDANGAPIALNAGQAWITMVRSNDSVSYRP